MRALAIGIAASFSQSFFVSFPQFSPSKLSYQLNRHVRSMSMTVNSSVVEHVVLFNVKQGLDDSAVDNMLKSLNSLSSLEGVLQLSAVPIHRISSPIPFNYVLHSRYPSKEALSAYGSHPAHVEAVKNHVLPACSDLMAVDWVFSNPSSVLLSAGSSVRVTFMKLKEGVGCDAKERILGRLKGDGASRSCGDNFSPRGKGYSLASLVEFAQPSDLEAENEEKEEDHVENRIVVDFVVPGTTSHATF